MTRHRRIAFEVNGRRREARVPANRTLLEMLRDLGHTEVKCGCEKGDCGACAVLVDGELLDSCLVLARRVEGRGVTTVAGLAGHEEPHPLPAAFAEAGAIQCGFCTPGMIVAAKALLDRIPHPDDEDIRSGLDGNLCRCTGYARVPEAVRRAAASLDTPVVATRPQPRDVAASGSVGRPLVRSDAPAKAAGTARYAGDFAMPGMLHARVVRSSIASGRLRRIDARRARALDGVACVLTGGDLGAANIALGPPLLADEHIRRYGEPLALIAAESAEVAARAASMVDIAYDETEGVFDPFEAMKPGAPVIHGNDNVVARHRIRKGDLRRGFAAAETVVESTFTVGRMEHAFLEPETGLAWVDEAGVVNIWVSTQVAEHYRAVASVLGVAEDQVRVHCMVAGGAFGGKESVTAEVFLALLAWETWRPVRLALGREESFLAHGQRNRMVFAYRTGLAADGAITALDVDITADAGADLGVNDYLLFHACNAAVGPYRIDNVSVDARAVATNNLHTEALRGFGAGLACAAYEAQMDEVAKALGLDRLEVRRRNLLGRGDTTATGQVVGGAVWTEECMGRAWGALGRRTADRGAVKVGRGLACCQQFYGRIVTSPETAEAEVGVGPDGTVRVRSCVPDIGGGQVSALGQIAAEVLGVAAGAVRIEHTDSTAPPAGPTGVSAQVYMSGNAVRLAAAAVRDRLLGAAAEALGVDAGDLAMADSRVFVAARPERSMELAEVAGACAEGGVFEHAVFRAPFDDGLDPETGQGNAYPDFTFGAHAVEVAVDTETGQVTVLKSVGCHDVGRAINPAAVRGQIEGGAVMGLGCALTEEMRLDDGRPATPSLGEYLIPTIRDAPAVNRAIILESRSGLGPYGAKGVGEAAFTPVAPAIANAVAEAIGGRVFETPMTPERIVRALKAAAETGAGGTKGD